MTHLKLLALDAEDLAVISAHMQDSVFKTGDLSYSPSLGHFTIVANRFVWETAEEKGNAFERRRTAVVFKRVRKVRSTGVDRRKNEDVLSLLAIVFTAEGEGPEGTVELTFSGKAAIVLDVECIEAQLADTGPAWETGSRPAHPEDS